LAPALTARKLGTIHRIRLVCCPSCGLAAFEEDAEPAVGEGVGASGIAVTATSLCWGRADESKPAFSCAIAGIKANKKTAPLITSRIVASPHSAKTAGHHGRAVEIQREEHRRPGNVKTIEFHSKDRFCKLTFGSLMPPGNFGSTFSSIAEFKRL
jgi:hypothetical protein